VTAQALLYLERPEDARGGLHPVLGRPVAFRTIVAALRAGARRVGVPPVFRGTAVERAVRASPTARDAVVWLADDTPPWSGPVLLLPATLLATPAALAAVLATERTATPGAPHESASPIATIDAAALAGLWRPLREGAPLGTALAPALHATGTARSAAGADLVRVTEAEGAARGEALLYRSLGSPQDTWLDRRVHRRLSRPLSAAAVAAGITPNQLSLAALLVGLAAIWCLWRPTLAWAALGLAGYLASVVLDHADGEVARLTLAESKLGEWVDLAVDTVVNAGLVLAIGDTAALAGGPAWLGPLAAAGVVASAVAVKLRPPAPGAPAGGAARRVLDGLGNRDGVYLILLVFVALVAWAPAWLPALLVVVASGCHAFWVGRLALALR
jgi:hypothetical protein